MVDYLEDLRRSSVLYALSATALVLCLVKVTEGQYGSQIGCMDNVCNEKLHNLLERYEYAASEVNGCDTDCMYNCYDVLKEGLSAKDGVSCPPFDELTRCFGIYANEWVSLAEECSIFNIKEQKEAAEAEAEAPSPEGEGESAEAEAEAPSSEGEGESAEAEAEAPSSEGEGEGEGEGECSASSGGEGEGEGEASDVGSGCFPDFETYEDFQKYVQGAYYSSVWNQPTNTVGVILSVFFWLSLAGMGVYLGRKS